MTKSVEVFYGFAENKQSEINFNFPIIIDEINIEEGQLVAEGDTLVTLKRIKPKISLQDELYKIDKLKKEEQYFVEQQLQDIKLIELREEEELLKLNQEIEEIKREKKSLNEIATAMDVSSNTKILDARIDEIEANITLVRNANRKKIELIKKELEKGSKRFDSEVELQLAELKFDEETKVIYDEIRAPISGIVGDIMCKEGEHIPAFKTLFFLYEKNPIQVKGYIYENQQLQISINDEVIVHSVANPEKEIKGVISGIGSRIVEIPKRLRKVPDMVIYGKEILVTIPFENGLLQKEKVSISKSI